MAQRKRKGKRVVARRRMLPKCSVKAEQEERYRAAHAAAADRVGGQLSFAAWMRAAMEAQADRDLG